MEDRQAGMAAQQAWGCGNTIHTTGKTRMIDMILNTYTGAEAGRKRMIARLEDIKWEWEPFQPDGNLYGYTQFSSIPYTLTWGRRWEAAGAWAASSHPAVQVELAKWEEGWHGPWSRGR